LSAWSENQSIIADWPKTVVINEVAWAGTKAKKSSDEWLELYNNSDSQIDISNWQILVSGEALNFTDLVSPIIPASGYLLLERTDNTSVADVEVDIIYTGGLGNSGELLQLVNETGDIIDEVDCSGGWLAGDSEDYRTMKRVSSEQPGSLASNWESSIGVAVQGQPWGGGVIYGSPKYQNTGYWLLKALNYCYTDQFVSNTWTLTLDNSPYIIDYLTEIPANYTLQVEPGVVLMGVAKTSYLNISGELQLNGTADQPVVITSALDTNYVAENFTDITGTSTNPGDWSRLEIQPNGKLTANHAKLYYGGQEFFQKGGFVFGGKHMAQVVRNLGGTVNLNNVEFAHTYTRDDETDYNTLIWTEAPSGYDVTTTIADSLFNGGWLAINNYGQNNGQTITASLTDSTLQNFTHNIGPILSERCFPEMSNNVFQNNTGEYIDLGSWTLAKDQTLSSGLNYLFSSISVPLGYTLTIEPDVSIKIISNIQIDGSLQAQGEAGSEINIEPVNSYWDSLIFNNSNSSLQYVNLPQGNDSGGLTVGMVTAIDSVLNFNQVNFSNADRPYNMLYLENSTTTISNSSLSWSEAYGGSKTIMGIKLSGGGLWLDNVDFTQMGIGIEVSDGASLDLQNMSEANFVDI